jgi:hypothetical protein
MALKIKAAFVDDFGKVIRIGNIAAASGSTSVVVPFTGGNSLTDYAVYLDTPWVSGAYVSSKSKSSFTVTYTDPGSNLTFNALVVLSN